MRAKEFFRQVRVAEEELKMLNAKLQHFEDLGMSISSGTGGTLGNKNRATSRVELAACGAVDALSAIQDLQREYAAIIAKAEAVIKEVPQPKYRLLLSYHYLCGKSLRWISDELDYEDPNSIYRAHGWAMREAQKVLDRRSQDEKEMG